MFVGHCGIRTRHHLEIAPVSGRCLANYTAAPLRRISLEYTARICVYVGGDGRPLRPLLVGGDGRPLRPLLVGGDERPLRPLLVGGDERPLRPLLVGGDGTEATERRRRNGGDGTEATERRRRNGGDGTEGRPCPAPFFIYKKDCSQHFKSPTSTK